MARIGNTSSGKVAMLPLEFKEGVARLKTHWAKGHPYSDEFCRLLFEALKRLPEGVFEHMVTDFILNLQRPPLMPEFSDASKRMAGSRASAPIKLREPCSTCNAHGYFLAKDADGYMITASCESCSTGAELRGRHAHGIIGLSEAKSRGFVRLKQLTEVQGDMPWRSSVAPGIPASVEALCLLIKSGRSNSGGFRWGLKYANLTDKEMWSVYETWLKGQVHPFALRKKKSLIEAVVTRLPSQRNEETA